MSKDINKPVRVFGLTLIQSEAVRKESSRWIKETHPRFIIYKCLTALAMFGGVIGGILSLHSVWILVIYVPLLVYLIVQDKLLEQYNKQAPEDLKLK